MGRTPKRTGPKETTIRNQQIAVEDAIAYFFSSPESSTITSAQYDPDTEVLTITFAFDGSAYQYDKFPRLVWIDFLAAPSKGAFFSKRIRPVFSGKKVS